MRQLEPLSAGTTLHWDFPVPSRGSLGWQHLPACCRVLLLPQGSLTLSMDILVTFSCCASPARGQEGWWLPWPRASHSSSYPSDSISRQGRVNPHISRVLGRLAAGILPAQGDNKHLMNDLPQSVSLQWKNNASGAALCLKLSFFKESSSITGNLTETPVFSSTDVPKKGQKSPMRWMAALFSCCYAEIFYSERNHLSGRAAGLRSVMFPTLTEE